MGLDGTTLKKYLIKIGPMVTEFKERNRQEETRTHTEKHVNVNRDVGAKRYIFH